MRRIQGKRSGLTASVGLLLLCATWAVAVQAGVAPAPAPPAAGEYKDKIVFLDATKPALTDVRVDTDTWYVIRYYTADSKLPKYLPAPVVKYVVYGVLPELENVILLHEKGDYEKADAALQRIAPSRALVQRGEQLKQYFDYYCGCCKLRLAVAR